MKSSKRDTLAVTKHVMKLRQKIQNFALLQIINIVIIILLIVKISYNITKK